MEKREHRILKMLPYIKITGCEKSHTSHSESIIVWYSIKVNCRNNSISSQWNWQSSLGRKCWFLVMRMGVTQSPQPFELRRKLIKLLQNSSPGSSLLPGLADSWWAAAHPWSDTEVQKCIVTGWQCSWKKKRCWIIKRQVSTWQLHNKLRMLVFW